MSELKCLKCQRDLSLKGIEMEISFYDMKLKLCCNCYMEFRENLENCQRDARNKLFKDVLGVERPKYWNSDD